MTTFLEELEEILGSVDSQAYAEARLALEIATQFAALREQRGLTQRQLAERLGRTQQAVSKIENPTHAGHSLSRLKAAVAALDATLDVTIVPLEDLAAYEALRPPKPTLEAIQQRLADEQSPTKRSGQQRCFRRSRGRITVGKRLRKTSARRSGVARAASPSSAAIGDTSNG